MKKQKRKEPNIPKDIQKAINTQDKKKVEAYFEALVATEDFQKKITKLRKKYCIPKEGIKKKGPIVIPPNEQDWYPTKKHRRLISELEKEIEVMCYQYNLHFLDWLETFEFYIFYNEIVIDPLDIGLCKFVDRWIEEKEPFCEEYNKAEYKMFPFAIRFSQYATKRDLLDYIKKAYPLIKRFQRKLQDKKVKVGRIRKKNKKIKDRNELIYQNRNLPIKKIVDIVYKRMRILLDEGSVSKILSLERKRRKKL